MVEPPVPYLEPTVPAAARQIGVSIGTAGCACLALSCAISSTTVSLLHYLRQTATVMARKRVTLDGLEATREAARAAVRNAIAGGIGNLPRESVSSIELWPV
jgi:hypothetical protein